MFGWLKRKAEDPSSVEQLVPTPIPALVEVLALKEREKGAPLTEEEVIGIRDNAVCMMLPISAAHNMVEARGYSDLDPEFIWEQWQDVRQDIVFDDPA